jgi:hypothetical protein
MQRMNRAVAGLVGVSLFAGLSAKGVSVQEMGIGANEVVQITSSTLGTAWVYAGIVNLQVNGSSVQGFCIDPYHWSSGGVQTYSMVPLTQAPKAPGGPMNAATATKIEQLWAHDFSPAMGNVSAAGLQIAIWELVTGVGNTGNTGTFSLNSGNDYGAGQLISWVNSNPNAPTANLVGLTGPGQDYVIPSVPDGAMTIILLGMGLLVIMIAPKKLRVC